MTVERHPRSARRYHAAVYVLTLLLLATGWWLLAGREGQPSPVSQLTGIPDVRLHVWLGWALGVVAIAPLPFALRGIRAFIRETLRFDRGDLRWLARLPVAVVTGRFGRHEGHFDPGQRIANVAIVVLLGLLLLSGATLALMHGGPLFAAMATVHKVATYAFTIVIAGHIAVALGILPGYRGVWRSMHLGGRVRLGTARRLWPGWTERQLAREAGGEAATAPAATSPSGSATSAAGPLSSAAPGAASGSASEPALSQPRPTGAPHRTGRRLARRGDPRAPQPR